MRGKSNACHLALDCLALVRHAGSKKKRATLQAVVSITGWGGELGKKVKNPSKQAVGGVVIRFKIYLAKVKRGKKK